MFWWYCTVLSISQNIVESNDVKEPKQLCVKCIHSGNIVRSSTVKGIPTVKGSFRMKPAACRTPSNEPPFGSCDRLERLETQQEEPSEVSENEGAPPAAEAAAAPKEPQAPVKVGFNTLRLRQNCCHFPGNIFKCIFLNENVWILIKFSLKFVPKFWINSIPALV